MKIEVSKRARKQIEKINKWWVVNRPAAPDLFLAELADAERLLQASPEMGKVYTEHKTGTVRFVLLKKTKHYLYYRFRPDRDELIVLMVWGVPRKRKPKL